MAHQNGISVYGEAELLDQIGTSDAAIAVRIASLSDPGWFSWPAIWMNQRSPLRKMLPRLPEPF